MCDSQDLILHTVLSDEVASVRQIGRINGASLCKGLIATVSDCRWNPVTIRCKVPASGRLCKGGHHDEPARTLRNSLAQQLSVTSLRAGAALRADNDRNAIGEGADLQRHSQLHRRRGRVLP